jgi:heme/copper-type cytochrome/quinol oxidase subunit 1
MDRGYPGEARGSFSAAPQWITGVSIFSFGLMPAGVEGQPRRVPVSLMPEAYLEESWAFWDKLAAIGGSITFISGVLIFVVMIGTSLRKKSPAGEATEFPVADCIRPKSQTPAILDHIGLWTIVGVVLIAIAYIPVFLTHNHEFTSRGFYPWGPQRSAMLGPLDPTKPAEPRRMVAVG